MIYDTWCWCWLRPRPQKSWPRPHFWLLLASIGPSWKPVHGSEYLSITPNWSKVLLWVAMIFQRSAQTYSVAGEGVELMRVPALVEFLLLLRRQFVSVDNERLSERAWKRLQMSCSARCTHFKCTANRTLPTLWKSSYQSERERRIRSFSTAIVAFLPMSETTN